jgi:hypothetical protein
VRRSKRLRQNCSSQDALRSLQCYQNAYSKVRRLPEVKQTFTSAERMCLGSATWSRSRAAELGSELAA